jgi:outer membrane lipoprotein-sorting protein
MRSSRLRPAICLAILALVAPAAQAQTVDEIVAKNIEAKGGAGTLKSTTSVRTTGTGSMQGSEVTMTSFTKRPNLVRNEMSMAGQSMVMGSDGETVWMAAPGLPAKVLPPGPQTESLKQTSQIDSPLLNYRERGTTIELGEPVTEGGRKLHHLIVRQKTGPVMHYFLDAATGLEAKMVIDVEEAGQQLKMEMRFSDFRTVEGRTVPYRMTQFVNGNQVSEIKFEKIEFNVPMEDSLFRIPK